MPLAASTIIPQKFRFRSWLSHHTRTLWLRGGIVLALAIGIATAYGLSSVQSLNVKRAVGWVEHTQEVIVALEWVLDDAADAETGQHGFLLTGEETYLEPYRRAVAATQGNLARALELTKDDAGQQDRLHVLQALLRARLLVAARTVELAQNGDREQAIAIVKSGRGMRLMTLARQTVAAAEANELNLLEVRRADWERTRAWWSRLLLGVLFAAATGTVLGGIAFARMSAARTAMKEAAAAERQRLLDSLDLAAIIVRDLDGTIRFWSAGCQSLYGWTAEEAIGQPSHALLRTVFPEPLSTVESALLRDGTWTGELRHHTKDNAEVIVSARMVLRRDDDAGPAIMENVTDITEQRHAEAALRANETMMDLAAIMVRDLDGTIRLWSRGCRALFGWTAEQAVGQSSHALLKTVFPAPLADIRAALLRDGTWRGEVRHRRQDGSEVIVSAYKVLRREADGSLTIMENVTDVTEQRRAEAALRANEAMMDLAAIMVRDFDGTIRFWSEGCRALFGWTAEQAVGQSSHILLQTVFPVPLADIQAALLRDGSWRGELRHRRQDGCEVTVSAHKALRREADGSLAVMENVTDVTEQRRAEAALHDSEARLRLVQAVGSIAATDRALPDGETIISEEFVKLYGLPSGQTRLSAAEFLALVHPDDCNRMELEADAVCRTGGTYATEFRIRRPDGAVRWVAMRAELFLGEDGKPQRVISAQQDITELVAAREAQASLATELERRVAERTVDLAHAEARFRAIFDSQLEFIGLLNADGIMLEMNRTVLEATGQAREDIIGRPFWENTWWPAAERDRLREEIAQAARGTVIRREVKHIGADGREIWVDFSLKPVRVATTGEVVWIIPEGRDITEQRRLSGQLVQAQKVQALGQLASGIAHDFNNILQAVEGAATLIERRPEDLKRTRRLARMAIDATVRGGSITQRLLSFARRGEFHPERLPTAEILTNIREVLAHTLGTSIIVHSITSPDVPPIIADRGQLETALVNLGTNARDALPEGGTLTLTAEAERVGTHDYHPAGLAPGDYVRLSVTDTGTGMDVATLARATEEFFTTKAPGQGTGLGLPMVKSFAEQSGGAMSITSTPGAGTTVTLWLPQAMGGAAQAISEADSRKDALDASAHVLLVDDDDMVREMLAAQLEELGFTLLVASGGVEAVALLEAGEAVDALVSDLSMPGMNGVTTIEKARSLRPGLPCFLLTGYVGERAALAAGDAFTLVRKPVSAPTLAARIEAGIAAATR